MSDTILITTTCPMCGQSSTITVPTQGFNEWRSGKKHIQDALPSLSSTDREKLISGICQACWDTMWQ